MKRALSLLTALFLLAGMFVFGSEVQVRRTTSMYAFNTGSPTGIVKFPLTDPVLSDLLYVEDKLASAAAFANGIYYVALCDSEGNPDGIYAYDLSDGSKTLLSDMSTAPSIISEMTYDYTTSTMYCLGEDYPSTSLMTLDLTTGQLQVVASFNLIVLNTLACSPEGDLYTCETSGQFSRIDVESGELIPVANLELYLSGLQSMEFDYYTGKLYFSYMRYGNCFFNEIDMTDYTVRQIGSFTSGSQIIGLFPAHTAATPSSPSAVQELALQSAANGNLEAELTWINPSKTNSGESLTSIDSVCIYRNDTLLVTLQPAEVGGEMSYIDKPGNSGYMYYTVIAYNGEGEGMWNRISGYVGRDIPAAPDSVWVEKLDANSVEITWSSSKTGFKGGWFDLSTLRYRVLRMPDSVVVADNLADTTMVDENVTVYNRYEYQVYAVNADGVGGSCLSEGVFLGNEVDLPFLSSFLDMKSLSMWTCIDGDGDGKSWQIGKLTGSRNGAESYADKLNFQYPLDNWLISPPMVLEEGREYQLSVNIRTAYSEDESFKVRMGTGPTSQEQTILLCDTTVRSYYGTKLVLPVTVEEEGRYYISFHHDMPIGKGFVLHFEDFEFKINDEGSLSGHVVYQGEPVQGAKVVVADSISALTDAEGAFSFPVLIQGKYPISVTALGFKVYEDTVLIETKKETELTVELEELPVVSLNGMVKSSLGESLAGARVSLNGYDQYFTYSDAQGRFSIEGIYAGYEYQFHIVKNGYTDFDSVLKMDEDMQLDAKSLDMKTIPSAAITLEKGLSTMNIHWERPYDTDEFKYDNGNMHPERSLGYDAGTEDHIMATVYRNPSLVRYAKWITRSVMSDYKATELTLYIFDLDEEGNPTSNVLYKESGIPAVDDKWYTHTLDSAVLAPRGFMMALSGIGNVSLACDTNTIGSLQVPKTNAYSTDWATPAYLVYFEENDWNFHLMLRAEAEPIEPQGASQVDIRYDLYRFEQYQVDNPQEWDLLAENLSETDYVDEDFASLPQGIYQYAVRAVYPGSGMQSGYVISDSVPVNMWAAVTFDVSTNDQHGSADGASIRLSGTTGREYTATVVNGSARIMDIWKDTYELLIVKTGYDTLKEEVQINKKDDYTLVYELVQTLAPVKNVDVLDGETASEKQVLWNTYGSISDGFEDKDAAPDFQINPASVGGWQYIDADASPTYRFGSTSFPSSGGIMAAVLFNPSATVPAHPTKPYEGERMLAFFCPSGGIPADDWMISPELDYHKDFTFSFHARKFNDDGVVYNDELISVGYSVTDAEPGSFFWLDSAQVVPTEWTEYTYSIPSKAKYVVIRRQCTDGFILFVDNVRLTVELPEQIKTGDSENYRVYLDGKQLAETQETGYLLTGLKDGHYIVGISQVYETGESEQVQVEFDVKGSSVANQEDQAGDVVVTMTSADRYDIKGSYRSMQLVDIYGRVVLRSVSGETSFDLSALPSGMYLMHILGDAGNEKVVKIILR